jgi:hypothetical protein
MGSVSVRCEVVIKTRKLVTAEGRPREQLMKCGKPAREFVITRRNGLTEARAKLCLCHASRLGDKWLVFTAEYFKIRAMSTDMVDNPKLLILD